jgi:phage shock protein C
MTMNKRLTRSRDHRIISGVCGGLGEYFGIDPIIFRFMFVALLMAGGSSFVIYIILLIVVPKAPVMMHAGQPSPQPYSGLRREDEEEAENSTKLVIGLLLIAVGVFMLLHNLVPYFRLEKLWPAILVVIGLGLLFQKSRKREDHHDDNHHTTP